MQGTTTGGGTAVTIEYKEFGVALKFRPVVLGDGSIRMTVASEVSELSDIGAVELEGFRVPSVATRRAETTLEMKSGQSFAMAGLISESTSAISSQVPGLGNLPVLGALFRSVRYRRGESELLLLVTASLVEPTSDQVLLPLPGTTHVVPNDWELYSRGRLEGEAPARLSPDDRTWLAECGLERLRGPGAWSVHGQAPGRAYYERRYGAEPAGGSGGAPLRPHARPPGQLEPGAAARRGGELSRQAQDARARNEILLVTRDAETERAVAFGAEGDGQVFGRVSACRDLAALERELAGRPRTRLVLVDVDPEPLSMLAGVESIMRRHGQPRYVVICSELDNDLVLEAMQIGARHCLVKSALESDLVPVLRRLLEGVEGLAPRASGQVITVLTASGGAGGTTLAINLADELRTSSGRASLLVDLDLHYGAMATYLGLNPEYGVADLLNTRGTIDAQLVRSTASAHLDDLHVLTSPASLDRPGAGVERFDKLESVLAVCREAYALHRGRRSAGGARRGRAPGHGQRR